MVRDLSVELCGITLDNPVIPASGTFGFGEEMSKVYDLDILGSISIKGTTREPRFGNPTPRIAECSSGMINAVGLQNPGVDAVIEHELPELRKVFHKPIIANISGFSIEEYSECCAKIDKAEQVEIIEVRSIFPQDLLLSHNGTFLADALVARQRLARAAHARAKAAAHALLKAHLPRGCGRPINCL